MANVSVYTLEHFDPARRVKALAPYGSTIREIVAGCMPGLTDLSHVSVTIGEHKFPMELWAYVRPKPGTAVIVRTVPGDQLKSILTVVVSIAAIAVGQFYLGPLLGNALFAGGISGYGAATASTATIGFFSAVSAGALSIAGSLLLNALIPTRSASNDAASPSYAIQGLQNVLNPDAPIPEAMGTYRWASPYAAKPFTQVIGDDQYAIASLLLGHGPLDISDICIGDTPIDEFSDVVYEVRYGYDDDEPLTLYPEQVLEDGVNATLSYPVDSVTGSSGDGAGVPVLISRFTALDALSYEVEFFMPQGVVSIDSKGNKKNYSVGVKIEQRLRGEGDFSEVTTLTITNNVISPFRRSYRWDLPTRDIYEIRVSRTTQESKETTSQGLVSWSVGRSFRPEYPILYSKPLALLAVKIRASNQLNGQLNNINCTTKLIVPDYDAATGTWIRRATNNPASLYRRALQGPANVYPKADHEIDLAGLAEWHTFCAIRGLAYNRIHDYSAARLDVMADIAAAGRATPRDDGTKWGVVIDAPQTVVVGHISSRNSWGFQGETVYPKNPDAFRVKFPDETNGFVQAERLVPFPDFVGDDPQVIEEISMPGITNPDLIFKEARRRQLEIEQRPHSYSVSQDIEGLDVTRGDLVMVNHDVLDSAQASARVLRISGRSVLLDQPVRFDQGNTYYVRFRLSDGSSLKFSASSSVIGETSLINVVGDISDIQVGDLALFGTTTRGESVEMIVNKVQFGQGLTCTLSLVDHAPQIDAEVGALSPPAWVGRYGEVVDFADVAPAVPVIRNIITVEGPVVQVTPGISTTAGVVIQSYVVAHRPSGVGSYTEVAVPSAGGVAMIAGYSAADMVDIKVRGLSYAGASSAFSAVTVYTVHLGPTYDDTLSASLVPFYSWDDATTTLDTV